MGLLPMYIFGIIGIISSIYVLTKCIKKLEPSIQFGTYIAYSSILIVIVVLLVYVTFFL